jgi:fermentation-respiration switch protein FrsA (DUF1100 family)
VPHAAAGQEEGRIVKSTGNTEGGAGQPGAQEQLAGRLLGTWLGTLEVGVVRLRVVFRFSKDAGGALKGVADSPDQGTKDIPVQSIELTGDGVRLSLPSLGATFEGGFRGGSEISGTWKQGPTSLPLRLESVAEAPKLNRPQEPKGPRPYQEREVSFASRQEGVTLAGTLTLPSGTGPHPAALLVSGSGPQNRDEEVFGHRPFLVLADALTRRGIAVLRFDDRGVGGSGGDPRQATSEDFALDAEGGVDFLAAQPQVARGRIGIIGHSEGGLIAPLVATRSDRVGFLVLLAAPGVPGEQLLLQQSAAILRATGAGEAQVERARGYNTRIYRIVREESDPRVAAEKIRPVLREAGVPAEQTEGQLAALLLPWYRWFLVYDPRPALRALRIPVLALIGGKDLQVPPAENLPAIEEALASGGNSHHTVRELPGLNHLFQTAGTGLMDEYPRIEETFAPQALEAIGSWILRLPSG